MSLSWTALSGTVSGLAASTAYTFTVSAFNSAGESAQSGQVQATTSASGGGGGGGFAVAPYVDMTNSQEPMPDKAATQAGLKAFTAAFVIGSGCTRGEHPAGGPIPASRAVCS